MKERSAAVNRATKETNVTVRLDLTRVRDISIEVEGLPFFRHLLEAMSFHGGFSLAVSAKGDIDVDPHHLVEDLGIVLGDAFARIVAEHGNVERFGHAVIPMDDALAEVTIDAGGRAYLVYEAHFPQERAGSFDLALVREFLHGFSSSARVNLHAHVRYGDNGHHMAEALFKALGKALALAYRAADTDSPLSTKGSL